MRYIVLIGKPSSGKTTIGSLLVKNKIAKGVLSIEGFRKFIYHYMPIELNKMIKEDLAWELFKSSIVYKEYIDETAVINLCGLNAKEQKVVEELKRHNSVFIMLNCSKNVLSKRIKLRKDKSKTFPYSITRLEMVKYGFGSWIDALPFDLKIDTGRLTIKYVVNTIKNISEARNAKETKNTK